MERRKTKTSDNMTIFNSLKVLIVTTKYTAKNLDLNVPEIDTLKDATFAVQLKVKVFLCLSITLIAQFSLV